jgi:peptidoglycan/xylan/chitin deacetylase (PgdA/CDA1 family)
MHALRRHPREWLFMTWFLIVGGIGVAVMLVVLGAQSPTERAPSAAQVTAANDLTQSFDIRYPVLRLDSIDAQLKDFAEQQTAKFTEKIKDRQYDPRNKLTVNYAIPHHGEKVLSVVFTTTEETVDTKPVTTLSRQVFDIASGKRLAIEDLFREDADSRGVLANIFYDYFQSNEAAKLTPQQQLKLLQFTTKDVKDFLVFEDALLLFINPSDLSRKVDAQGVLIQKSVISSILKSAYVGKDAGPKLDTAPENVAYAINELPKRSLPNAGSGKRLALTFDDGPSVHTGRLLDTLALYRSHATFYVLGHLAQAYAGDLQRMVGEGHEIGNHTWMHANLTLLDNSAFNQQIGDTQRAIQTVTGGYTPRTLRPPYGATNDAVKAQAQAYGLHEVLWSVDPNDWQIHDSQLMYDRIMGGAADGRVILLHDIYGTSVDAAIRAIPDLIAQGYQLVTVSELYGY